jgi:hypothetical protein
MFFLDQLLGISGCHVAQMAIEDFFDDFMELLDAVSVEGATRATLDVRLPVHRG